ncbi:hypothetical protein CesoFtcFv8_005397 [Champsocephalus esox]|uniref:Metalloprotease TIKI n=1 Tax=Champsocephalus esox TaxID=159716 RepID=A0AAN8CSI7_9TELE|nr:hypothetical protein CesoFtcFv8_005397 [Champsocephalus esox]
MGTGLWEDEEEVEDKPAQLCSRPEEEEEEVRDKSRSLWGRGEAGSAQRKPAVRVLGQGSRSSLSQAMKHKRLEERWRGTHHPQSVLFALNQTLLQHEGVRAGSLQGSFTTEDLITHYNCGDLSHIIFNHDTSQLPHFINSSLPAHDRTTALQIDSYFRRELIYKRNERMARRVSALLQRNPNQTFFFAFGAGHFLGNHSVLELLRQEGYEIVHVHPDHPEPDTGSKPAEDSEGTDPSTTSTDSWMTGSPDTELELEDPEDMPGLGGEELPHILLPDSLSQLEEFGRHKRPRKTHRGHGRPRLFSDLWVRIGDSVRIVNGYVTVEPPLTHQEQHRRTESSVTGEHPDPASPSSSPPPNPRSAQSASVHSALTPSCLLAWLLSHMLLTS